MKVAIIGAGIIGLATAYYLNQRGVDVEIVDRAEPGMACSWGNLGWVCPSLSEPVPGPGIVNQSLRWMVKQNSPLYIQPRAVPHLFWWLLEFWRHCTSEAYAAATRSLLEFSQPTFNLYDTLIANGLEFEMHRQGLLFAFLDELALRQRLEHFGNLTEYGYAKPQVLTRSEILGMEPNLTPKIIGGILLPDERHVRTDTLTQALVQWLKARNTVVLANTEVTTVQRSGTCIRTVSASSYSMQADRFLLTAGAWTGLLAKKFGFNLPITAGKGYSITIKQPNLQFTHPIYFGDNRTEITPYNGLVRLGGTMELSGINTVLNEKRIDSIRKGIREYLGADLHGQSEVEWTGMRPMAPDGLPILGRAPGLDNVYVATGHGMMGVSMSLVTGLAMANMIMEEDAGLPPNAFSPSRFLSESQSIATRTTNG